MERLTKAVVAMFSLAVGLAATGEICAMLPSWEGESRLMVAVDAVFLLLSLVLVSGLVYYLLSDVGLWLLKKLQGPPRE